MIPSTAYLTAARRSGPHVSIRTRVRLAIPMYSNSIEIHFEDMVGNARMGTITASNDYAEEETGETESDS